MNRNKFFLNFKKSRIIFLYILECLFFFGMISLFIKIKAPAPLFKIHKKTYFWIQNDKILNQILISNILKFIVESVGFDICRFK